MTKRTKLELTWIGKDARPRLEPRILLEDAGLSYHAARRVSEGDEFDNRVIFGDNLLALKVLEAEFAGKVKCIYIDPPYNTGSAFTHYDDGLEHSLWLTMMRDRLKMLRRLLAEDGSIWITLDDNEVHYAKVLCDEVFGRANFIATVIWQKVYTIKNTARHLSEMHDYVLVYAKRKESWESNPLQREAKQDLAYKNPDNDPRGNWKATPLHARNFYSLGKYKVQSPFGRIFNGPSPGRYWIVSEESFLKLNEDGRIWWGKDGNGTPNKKTFAAEVKQGVTPSTIWFHEDAGHNAQAKNEINALALDVEVFITPKPEKLIYRVLQLATQPGDLVLDSFAGSGTTGAVAHKMRRRFILVELGEHVHTHIIPRLRQVVDGTDEGTEPQSGGCLDVEACRSNPVVQGADAETPESFPLVLFPLRGGRCRYLSRLGAGASARHGGLCRDAAGPQQSHARASPDSPLDGRRAPSPSIHILLRQAVRHLRPQRGGFDRLRPRAPPS